MYILYFVLCLTLHVVTGPSYSAAATTTTSPPTTEISATNTASATTVAATTPATDETITTSAETTITTAAETTTTTSETTTTIAETTTASDTTTATTEPTTTTAENTTPSDTISTTTGAETTTAMATTATETTIPETTVEETTIFNDTTINTIETTYETTTSTVVTTTTTGTTTTTQPLTTPAAITEIVTIIVNETITESPDWIYGVMGLFGALLLMTLLGFLFFWLCCCEWKSLEEDEDHILDIKKYDTCFYYDPSRDVWVNPKTGAMFLDRPLRNDIESAPATQAIKPKTKDPNSSPGVQPMTFSNNSYTPIQNEIVPPVVITDPNNDVLSSEVYNPETPRTARDIVVSNPDMMNMHEPNCVAYHYPEMGNTCSCGSGPEGSPRSSNRPQTHNHTVYLVQQRPNPSPIQSPKKPKKKVIVQEIQQTLQRQSTDYGVEMNPNYRVTRRTSSLPDIKSMFTSSSKPQYIRLEEVP